MQEQIRDSVSDVGGVTFGSSRMKQSVFIETKPSQLSGFRENFYSKEVTRQSIPDWYFIIIILAFSSIAWARIVYGKFFNSLWLSAYSYQIATKSYREQGVVHKKFGIGLDFLYLISGSLFFYLLNLFLFPGSLFSKGIIFVFQAFLVLSFLIFIRVIIMRLTAHIFVQSELFLGFLYHYFLYNKVIGIVILPFLLAVPYTNGILQEILMFTGISMIIAVYILRLIRAATYVFKNVVLLFYLILYLCILEILPILVVIKIVLSLTQV